MPSGTSRSIQRSSVFASGRHVFLFYESLSLALFALWRFAIIPRYGNPADIRWFEAGPTHVWHWMNAYEEGDEIVLDGYFQCSPDPPPLEGMPWAMGKLMANIDSHSFQSRLHRWRFNLKTG